MPNESTTDELLALLDTTLIGRRENMVVKVRDETHQFSDSETVMVLSLYPFEQTIFLFLLAGLVFRDKRSNRAIRLRTWVPSCAAHSFSYETLQRPDIVGVYTRFQAFGDVSNVSVDEFLDRYKFSVLVQFRRMGDGYASFRDFSDAVRARFGIEVSPYALNASGTIWNATAITITHHSASRCDSASVSLSAAIL